MESTKWTKDRIRMTGRATVYPANLPEKPHYVVIYEQFEMGILNRDDIDGYLDSIIDNGLKILHSGEMPHSEYPQYFENCQMEFDCTEEHSYLNIEYNFNTLDQAEQFARLFEIDEIYDASEMEIIYLYEDEND